MTTLIRPLALRYVAGDNPARKVTWLELFFDLIFVAAVAQVGEPLREDYSFTGLVRFAVLFVLIWWAWIGSSVFATRFDTDDVLQRVLTLVQMFAVAAMAANATEALDNTPNNIHQCTVHILGIMSTATTNAAHTGTAHAYLDAADGLLHVKRSGGVGDVTVETVTVEWGCNWSVFHGRTADYIGTGSWSRPSTSNSFACPARARCS